jgi:hypothetical protein
MRGQRRTKEEKHELFQALEYYLGMGFSLKRACSLADVPYSTIRDMLSFYEPLRAHTTALQNQVNVTARANIVASIEQGDIQNSKWWLERFDYTEPQASPQFGGEKEMLYNLLETKREIEEGVTKEQVENLRMLL